ncbi:hypothetical protein [Streptomyces sp. NPDC057301]|uniref:hypothetical protein n=1 Tax=Streptomyces sp. NPDC057301 TaxID=3346093 RepID=UPI0036303196
MVVRRVAVVPDAVLQEQSALTRATDDRVGPPRPVTPPPVRSRSEFDRKLDAFRPSWLLERLTAENDLPSFVQARLAADAASSSEASGGTAPTPQAPWPSQQSPAPRTTAPAAPAARGTEQGPAPRHRAGAAADLPGPRRPRRHPQDYGRTRAPGAPGAPAAPTLPTAPGTTAPMPPTPPAAGLPAVVGTATPAPGDAGAHTAGAHEDTTGSQAPRVKAASPTAVVEATDADSSPSLPGPNASTAPAAAAGKPTKPTVPGTPEGPDGLRHGGGTEPSSSQVSANPPGWEAAWSLRLASGGRGRGSRRALPQDSAPSTSTTTGVGPSPEEDRAGIAPPPEADSYSPTAHEWPVDPVRSDGDAPLPEPLDAVAEPEQPDGGAVGTSPATTPPTEPEEAAARPQLPQETSPTTPSRSAHPSVPHSPTTLPRTPEGHSGPGTPPPAPPVPTDRAAYAPGPGPSAPGGAPGARHVAGPIGDLIPAVRGLGPTAAGVGDAPPSPARRPVGAPRAALSYAPPHRPVPTSPPSVPAARRPEQDEWELEREAVTSPEHVAGARAEVSVSYPALIAVGGTLPPEELALSRFSGSARTRAAHLWFGAARTRAAQTPHASPPAPVASWSAQGGGGDGPLGSVPSGALPPGPFTGVTPTAFPPGPTGEWATPPPPRAGSGPGGGPGSGGRDVPLDQTPEWAALMDLLAAHRRQRPFGHMDDPAFLDALAGRLHDRVLARIRRELVVDRERNGLLVPRT